MTIQAAINAANRSRGNEIPDRVMVKWLSDFDGQIQREVIDTHFGCERSFCGYGEHTDPDTEMLIGAPYDEIYTHLLRMRIDLENNDLNAYNADQELFGQIHQAWAAWYTRTHSPKGVCALKF